MCIVGRRNLEAVSSTFITNAIGELSGFVIDCKGSVH